MRASNRGIPVTPESEAAFVATSFHLMTSSARRGFAVEAKQTANTATTDERLRDEIRALWSATWASNRTIGISSCCAVIDRAGAAKYSFVLIVFSIKHARAE